MSGNNNLKAIQLLNQIQARTGITECEKNALIQVYNPFCDFEHKIVGWPSMQDTKSNVTKNDYTMTVGAPAGLDPGQTWDAHVCFTKQTNITSQLASASLANNTLYQSESIQSTGTFGGCSVMTKATINARPLNFTSTVLSSGLIQSIGPSISQDGSDPASDDMQKVHRAIAKGVEVRLAANNLTNQGSLVVWSQPETGLIDRISADVVGAVAPAAPIVGDVHHGVHDIVLGDDVPGTPSEALLLPNSKQWLAKQGVMMVGKLANWELKPQTMVSRKLFLRESRTPINLPLASSHTTVQSDFGCSTVLRPTESEALTEFTIDDTVDPPTLAFKEVVEEISVDDFNTSGAIFTGLDPAATLVINYCVYLESFPDTKSGTLVKLAQATEPYSALFPQMLSLMMRHMPVACVIADNKGGDWFFEGIQWLSNAISPALAMGGPVGKALSVASSAVSSWAGNKLKERKEAARDAAILADGWAPVNSGPARIGEFVNVGKPVTITSPSIQQIRARDRALNRAAARQAVVRPPGQGQSRRAQRRRALANPPMTPARAERRRRAQGKEIPQFFK